MYKDFDTYMEKMSEMWLLLNQFKIEIGVISSNSHRQTEEKYDYDISNAELMFIHENGTMGNGGYIPPRPVLQMTIDAALKKLVPIYMKKIENEVFNGTATIEIIKTFLGQLCMEMESYARNLIGKNDGRLQRNAPSTIRAKEKLGIGNHPLQVTGTLKKSITCQLVQKSLF